MDAAYRLLQRMEALFDAKAACAKVLASGGFVADREAAKGAVESARYEALEALREFGK